MFSFILKQFYYPYDAIPCLLGSFLFYEQGFPLKTIIGVECHVQRMRDKALSSMSKGQRYFRPT